MEIIVYMGENEEKKGINGRDHIRSINKKINIIRLIEG
jgi:hypothetical protein